MLRIRPVSDEDCRLLWEWVNEPGVRGSAFHSDPISWEGHVDWFQKKRSDPNCTIMILLNETDFPIGQVRFDMESEDKAEIAISVASDHRGCGYGTEAIRLACEYLRKMRPVTEVEAYIKPENLPSIRAFQKAGFISQGRRLVRGQEALWMNLMLGVPVPTRTMSRDELQPEVLEIVLASLKEVKEHMGKDGDFAVSPQTHLYGRGSDLDSLGLVSLVVDVEERIGERYGIPVTLTDEKALSQEKSPFRTVEALAGYVTELLLERGKAHVG